MLGHFRSTFSEIVDYQHQQEAQRIALPRQALALLVQSIRNLPDNFRAGNSSSGIIGPMALQALVHQFA